MPSNQAATETEQKVKITISENRMQAWLYVGKGDADSLTAETIRSALEEAKIPETEEITRRIKQVVSEVTEETLTGEPYLLAEGQEPINGEGARFEYLQNEQEEQQKPDDNERVDFYQSKILTVAEGEAIGTLIPEKPPQNGADVFGQAISAKKAKDSIILGENVQLADDGQTITATTAGKVHVNRRNVSVVEVVEIKEDVDFSTGNIKAPNDVLINGTVREAFNVESDKSITVRGTIEAADVKAGTDIIVNGGIISEFDRRVEAQGEVFSKFCEHAYVYAESDINIEREVMNCQLHTNSYLRVPNGALIGGYSYAREGGVVKELGNEANVKTEIAIGLDPQVFAECRRIDENICKKRETVEKIRQKVQPLMNLLKQLTPQQRERATELMYQADELENAIKEQEEVKKQLFAEKSPKNSKEACLEISKIIYPGVKIIIGDQTTVLHKERKGNSLITRRLIERVLEIVLVDKLSGSVTVLPSFEYLPEDSGQQE